MTKSKLSYAASSPLVVVLKLAHLAPAAIRELERARGGFVFGVPLRARHPRTEISFPTLLRKSCHGGSGPRHRERRVALKGPGLDLAAGILDVHEKMHVRILPAEAVVRVPVKSRQFLVSNSDATE